MPKQLLSEWQLSPNILPLKIYYKKTLTLYSQVCTKKSVVLINQNATCVPTARHFSWVWQQPFRANKRNTSNATKYVSQDFFQGGEWKKHVLTLSSLFNRSNSVHTLFYIFLIHKTVWFSGTWTLLTSGSMVIKFQCFTIHHQTMVVCKWNL